MRDIDLFQLALGLKPPWQVSSTEFNLEQKRLDIKIDFIRGSTFPCPECGQVALKAYDNAENEQEETSALSRVQNLPVEFNTLRAQLEKVYGKIRILTKPEGYILDQDHHTHLANQSVAFDWLFIAEKLFLEKIEKNF